MMSAALYNITINQGADWEIEVEWEDDDGPVDPTGWTAKMQIRSRSGSLLAELTNDNGIEIVGQKMFLRISAVDTSTIKAGFAQYDLKLRSPDLSRTYRLLEGDVKVSAAVTV